MSLVDSPAWSLALRRRQQAPRTDRERAIVDEINTLIQRQSAILIGAVRQELLSGLREPAQYDRLVIELRKQRDEACVVVDYEVAADFSNQCRRRGVQASLTDALVAAVAFRLEEDILSTDPDFEHLADILPIRLHALSRKTP
jgi:predicted nucleic acid-binding protein